MKDLKPEQCGTDAERAADSLVFYIKRAMNDPNFGPDNIAEIISIVENTINAAVEEATAIFETRAKELETENAAHIDAKIDSLHKEMCSRLRAGIPL